MNDVRAAARAWFAANWRPDIPLGEWWELLAWSGWGFPAWDTAWFGKGLPASAAAAVEEERRRAGAAGPPTTLGAKVIAPLLLEFGTDEQKRRYLLPTIAGRAVWCELFSEPGAGSDLASLAARAVRHGRGVRGASASEASASPPEDEWVVNGQKVWSSGATVARWGLLAARTDPDVPKRRGITCFVLDMEQPGVDARPLRTMTGEERFGEVFLTDARISHGDVVGDVGDGWTVVRATLALERGIIGGISENLPPPVDVPAGTFAAHEQAGRQRGATMMGTGARSLVSALLERFGGADDPVLRQEIARLYVLLEASRAASRRRVDPSVAKLVTSEVTRTLRDLAMRIAGLHGTLDGPDAPLAGVVARMFLTSPSISLMTGTDEILRTVVGERVLGLPREPAVDEGVPWRELRVGTQRR
jgi:alkylation response protein AidB-like acyl-CoA dehydrogenase